VNGEVSLVFAGRSGDDEAEKTLADAGEAVVVLHAVGRQGGGVNGDTESVLYVEGVHAGAVKGDGEDIIADVCLGNGLNAAGGGIDLSQNNPFHTGSSVA